MGIGSQQSITALSRDEARVARNLGSAIITDALRHGGGMSFESYDNTVADNGFGNLIALPLQGRARCKSNSLFVDDEFNPHKDQ